MSTITQPTRTNSSEKIGDLNAFYTYVLEHGKLRTDDHARRWTVGTLNMLGVNLKRSLKKELAAALPQELSRSLTGVFWLASFRNTNMPAHEFNNRVARRSRASSDPDFAPFPVQAVFGALKRMIGAEMSRKIEADLAPEIGQMWDAA